MSEPVPVQQRAFFWLSQLVVATYGRFPVFGPVRSAVGLIRRGDLWLTVERADRRGLCCPGGVAVPWESNEACLRREVEEETGLHVTTCRFLFEYFDRKFLPGSICVFEAEAEGEVKSSWEGVAGWSTLDQLASRIFPSQHVLLGYLEACARPQPAAALPAQPRRHPLR